MVEDFPFERFAEEAASGRVAVDDVARRVRSLVEDALVSGAARMARVFLRLLPPSLFLRRVVAWYASRHSPDFRVLPIRVGEGLDAAVDLWDAASLDRECARYEEVVREGSRERGSLLVFYAVVGPHGPGDLQRAFGALCRALGSELRVRGDGVLVGLPLPPEEELGEFDL